MTAVVGSTFGLPSPFLRHAFVLLLGAGALVLPALGLGLSLDDDFVTWLVVAAALGLVAGVAGRGWLGLLFVLVGVGLGVLFSLASTHGLTGEASAELAGHVASYAALLVVVGGGYVLGSFASSALRSH